MYLVAGLLAGVPLPVLLVFGEQGSGKTFLTRLLRLLIDPSSLATLTYPDSLREFVQRAAHHRTVFLDNLSYLPDWLSDALCRLCTGEGFTKRELYTDDGDVVYSLRGLGGITGINLVAVRPDLLDRALVLRLGHIPEEQRIPESELNQRFDEVRPAIFGALLDTLSAAMRFYPAVKLRRHGRLADFTRWGVAIARALGLPDEEFLDAYRANVGHQNEAALEGSVVAQSVMTLVERNTAWDGTATEMLGALNAIGNDLRIDTKAKDWPKRPNTLSRKLREVLPNLRRVGIAATESSSRGKVRWHLAHEGAENIATIATTATGQSDMRPVSDTLSLPPPGVSLPLPEGALDERGSDGRDDRDKFPNPEGRQSGSGQADTQALHPPQRVRVQGSL